MRFFLFVLLPLLILGPLLATTAPLSVVRSAYSFDRQTVGAETHEWEIISIRTDRNKDLTGKVCHPINNYRSCVGPKFGRPYHDICDTYTRSCPAKKPKGGKTNGGKKGHDDPPASASLLATAETEDDQTSTGNTTARAIRALASVDATQARTNLDTEGWLPRSVHERAETVHDFFRHLVKRIIYKGDDRDAVKAGMKDNGSMNVVSPAVWNQGGSAKHVLHPAGGHGHDAAEQLVVKKGEEGEEQPRAQVAQVEA